MNSCQVKQCLSDREMSGINGKTSSICYKEQKCQRPYKIECTLDKRTTAVYMYTFLTLL
jgi:hypothetical protein